MRIDSKALNLLKSISKPEKNAKKFGIFYMFFCAFGSLVLSYLLLANLLLALNDTLEYNMIVVFLSFGFTWAVVAFWLSLSVSKAGVLLRFLIPSLLLGILIIVS